MLLAGYANDGNFGRVSIKFFSSDFGLAGEVKPLGLMVTVSERERMIS